LKKKILASLFILITLILLGFGVYLILAKLKNPITAVPKQDLKLIVNFEMLDVEIKEVSEADFKKSMEGSFFSHGHYLIYDIDHSRLVYDNKEVYAGLASQVLLSDNGLHYAYVAADVDGAQSVFVDGQKYRAINNGDKIVKVTDTGKVVSFVPTKEEDTYAKRNKYQLFLDDLELYKGVLISDPKLSSDGKKFVGRDAFYCNYNGQIISQANGFDFAISPNGKHYACTAYIDATKTAGVFIDDKWRSVDGFQSNKSSFLKVNNNGDYLMINGNNVYLNGKSMLTLSDEFSRVKNLDDYITMHDTRPVFMIMTGEGWRLVDVTNTTKFQTLKVSDKVEFDNNSIYRYFFKE
jgi:hypothetical protein